MPKRLFFIAMMTSVVFALAACNANPPANEDRPMDEGDRLENNDVTDEGATETSNNNVAQTTEQDEMKAKMDELPFKEIEIEVSYSGGLEYEAEIEQDSNRPLKAEVEDELNGAYLKGQEAFNELYPKLQQLTITKDTPNEEVIQQVLNVFKLGNDYEKFEVEITFNDGTEREVKDVKR